MVPSTRIPGRARSGQRPQGPRLRLHNRILIPFAAVAIVATTATAYVALLVASRAVEARVQRQILSAATLVSRSEFALNPAILRSVKPIAGADVVTFDSSGRVLASTFEPSADAALRAVVAAGSGAAAPSGDAAVLREIRCDGSCYVAYRRGPWSPDAIVAVVASTAELRTATETVGRAIAVAAVLSLTAMIVVSQIVAKRVSAPLDELVRFSHEVAAGASERRAPVGEDEVGRLGAAFNEMLERLDQSRQALVRSEKLALAGLIAARVAHDIRNPLSSIKLQTQLLHARAQSEQERSVLSAILHDIATVEAVIRDLLELARPGAVQLRAERLNEIVAAVIEQLSPQLTYRKIRVETDYAAELPAVMLDAERFKGALLNVVVNAADAMTNGGALTVRTRRDDSTAVVDVCDDGSGIDPAVKDRLFDPFVSTKRDGVGLGLVNTKAIVESHGGTVALTSRSPRGTIATIRLPIRETDHG